PPARRRQARERARRRNAPRREPWRAGRDHRAHAARGERPDRDAGVTGLVRRIFTDTVPLRRGEWGLGLFLYGLLTVMVAADWVGKLGADALFVKRYGVQYVPFMYIITPLAMLAVSALIFFFVDRVRRRTMLLWYVAGTTALSVAIQLAISFPVFGNIVQPISYVFAHGVKETIYSLFWVYAGNLYDAQQSRRLFPFFAGSVLVGKILGGFIGAGIAPIVHAENFIGAQAVGFFVCFLALVAYRGLPEGQGRRVIVSHRPQGLRARLLASAEGPRAGSSGSWGSPGCCSSFPSGSSARTRRPPTSASTSSPASRSSSASESGSRRCTGPRRSWSTARWPRRSGPVRARSCRAA